MRDLADRERKASMIEHATLDPADVTDWVFDLDNTLYPRHCDLFGQIDLRMTAYVSRLTGLPHDDARRLQKQLYRDHGTTLNGLMREHDVDPHHYLADVHDIDYSVLLPDPGLGEAIAALKGRKHIFTNGDVPHARNALAAIGIAETVFDSIFDIVAADFMPKPMRGAYDRFVTAHGIRAERAVMFEDLSRNLATAKELGMTTVLVRASRVQGAEHWEHEGHDAAHVDHACDDIGEFLRALLENRQGNQGRT
ncbi:MAG: pyrimidine 5'-nucleotidase [Pseudomonadota bacterium]|nr:pyrimidine 5'-nucleotidase [Pseudomonadota bacterium]